MKCSIRFSSVQNRKSRCLYRKTFTKYLNKNDYYDLLRVFRSYVSIADCQNRSYSEIVGINVSGPVVIVRYIQVTHPVVLGIESTRLNQKNRLYKTKYTMTCAITKIVTMRSTILVWYSYLKGKFKYFID